MSFYAAISPYYDAIFPVDAEETSFIAKRLKGRKTLLDIGCGTGSKTVLYARAGRKIYAVDNDPEMIAVAKATNSGPGITYSVHTMMDVDRGLEVSHFDAVLCLGNTLVHLFRPAVIRAMIAKIPGLLADDGQFVIQILNYNMLLDKNINTLPLLETEHVRFERSYVPQGSWLRFVTKLTLKATGEEINNDIPLYPLRREELDEMLREAGFRKVEYYGAQGKPLTDDSLVLLVLASK